MGPATAIGCVRASRPGKTEHGCATLRRPMRRNATARERLTPPKGAAMSKEWPLWEVFIRSQHGLAHKHVGSLHASDAEMAIMNARDVYTRRNEGVSIWVVKASDIAASSPSEKGPLF